MQESQPDPNGFLRYASLNSTLSDPKSGETRVVFFGDSITDFWNLDRYFPGDGYINRGIAGQNTGQMRARLGQDVLELNPSVVWFLGGTNDIAQGISNESIWNNVSFIIRRCCGQGIRLVVGSLLPISDYHKDIDALWERSRLRPQKRIQEVNSGIREIADNEGAAFIDLFTLMVDSNGQMPANMADDGLHPNHNGYDLITSYVRGMLDQAKSRISRP